MASLSCGTWDLPSSLCHAASLVAACRIYSCHMWDLALWPGIDPGPPALGEWLSATGLPGKSLQYVFCLHHICQDHKLSYLWIIRTGSIPSRLSTAFGSISPSPSMEASFFLGYHQFQIFLLPLSLWPLLNLSAWIMLCQMNIKCWHHSKHRRSSFSLLSPEKRASISWI